MWVAMKKFDGHTENYTCWQQCQAAQRLVQGISLTMETLSLHCELYKTSCSNTHLPFHAHSSSSSYGKRPFW